MSDLITITIEEYADLLQSKNLLDALKEVGINNWEGYSEALAIVASELQVEDEEDEDNLVEDNQK